MGGGGIMSLSLFDLKDKVAMVTGSTRGLGEVAAIALGQGRGKCGGVRAQQDRFATGIRRY